MSDPGRGLVRALRQTLSDFGGEILVVELEQVPWASVTFAGARHRLCLSLSGTGAAGAAADFLVLLPELELPVPGHIVADIALEGESRSDDGRAVTLDLEALTVEDS